MQIVRPLDVDADGGDDVTVTSQAGARDRRDGGELHQVSEEPIARQENDKKHHDVIARLVKKIIVQ